MLLDFLFEVEDFRRQQGQQYDVGHVLYFSILAILSGAHSYRKIYQFIKRYFKKFKKKYGLKWKKCPSYNTIRNIILGIDSSSLELVFRKHAKELSKELFEEGKDLHLSFDGKVVRGSFDHFKEEKAIQVLSIFCSYNNIILAHEVLEYVGLKDQRYRKIETFSTGMMQATKLACALVHDPEILICDEPTNGLDQRAREFMLQTLRRTVSEGGRSVLMSSHVMDDVQDVCDRIVMIHKGKIVVQSRIDELAKQVDREIEISIWGGASRMQAALEGRGFEVRRLGRVIRVDRVDDNTTFVILEAAVEAGVQVRQMQEYEPDLEDIFLLIMDKLGAKVKGTSELMTESHTGGGSPE